jgi:hypothetical protein
MRVLVGPRTDLGNEGTEVQAARALAGPDGAVVSLRQIGVGDLSRPLTQAEVALLREALSGAETAILVGYVCKGVDLLDAHAVSVEDARERPAQVVAVTDHANLTWRSPLAGCNDDRIGPRFPSLTGVYEPQVVVERVKAVGGIIVKPGVVAGVGDDGDPNGYEARTSVLHGHAAASSELVPVVIVAAHMGLHVAAAVVTKGGSQEQEMGCGRS